MDLIRNGGPLMLLLFAVGLLAAPGALIALGLSLVPKLARTAVIVSTLVMASGVLALGIGAIGYALNLRSVEETLAMVNPQDAETIRWAGTAEALTTVVYGLGAGLLPFCLGVALIGLGLVRRPLS